MAKKSILTWHKERRYLVELTDEEIDEFRKSIKYQEDELFQTAIDAEYNYRLKKKATS